MMMEVIIAKIIAQAAMQSAAPSNQRSLAQPQTGQVSVPHDPQTS
jgi:hypothetical protein